MSEEQYASKRERQKARRAERLEREAAAARSAKGRQRAVYSGIILLVIALIGVLIYSQIAERREREQRVVEVEGRLDELGCTPDEQMPDLGGGHLDPTGLGAQPPSVLYTGEQAEPPSSGPHIASVAPTGVYDEPIDPRLTTHNLEHGYIIAHYAEDAPAEQVEALKTWAQERIDGDFPKVIVAPYYTDMANDASFSLTAWLYRQTCDTFDADVAQVFTEAHYESDEAPESTAATHNVGAGGVIDPEGEPLFFPPLDAEFGTTAPEVEGVDPAEGEEGQPAEDEPPAEGEDEPPAEGEDADPVEAVTE
ncbi:MAG TPA: DUF3105 domain-containing protein [Euzebya sp.]|nr:DUF3105 domain-containing protein [Euzebya sp.]